MKIEGDTVQVEVSQLQPPERTYAADFAYVREEEDDVHLIFVQVESLGGRPVTSVCIRYSKENFKTLVERTKAIRGSLRAAIEASGRPPKKQVALDVIAGRGSVLKSLTERATCDAISFFSGDAEIEFYFLSPGGFQRAKHGHRESGRGTVVPVLAVTLSSAMLLDLLDSAAAVAERMVLR